MAAHQLKQQSSKKDLHAYTRPFITLVPDLAQVLNKHCTLRAHRLTRKLQTSGFPNPNIYTHAMYQPTCIKVTTVNIAWCKPQPHSFSHHLFSGKM